MTTKSDLLDDDFITSPVETSNITVKKEFKNEEDGYNPAGLTPEKVSVSDGPLGDQIPNELPDVNITFKLINGNESKLATIEQIEQQILGEGKISQETILMIEEKIGDFLISDTHINKFTKIPSTIGLEAVKIFFKKLKEINV